MIKSNRIFLLGLSGLLVGGVVALAGIQLGWLGDGDKPIAGPDLMLGEKEPAVPFQVSFRELALAAIPKQLVKESNLVTSF